MEGSEADDASSVERSSVLSDSLGSHDTAEDLLKRLTGTYERLMDRNKWLTQRKERWKKLARERAKTIDFTIGGYSAVTIESFRNSWIWAAFHLWIYRFVAYLSSPTLGHSFLPVDSSLIIVR